jgi:YgiT-type zinc finger domain-containing protein
MTEKTITVDLRVNERLLIIEGVPAKVCDHCGEKVFTPAVTRKLQVLGKRRNKAPRTLKVPVFTMKESAP